MSVVDLYFDYLSPFAYLGTILGPEVIARNGAAVRFRPILFPALLNHWGQKGPAEIPPKALHAFATCLRTARMRGIPLRSPMFHPFNPLVALRVTLACATEEERARAVHALFALGWARGGDLADPASIAKALTAASLNGPELLAKTAAPEIKEALKRETEMAIGRGVFGVPTFVVNDALFWGIDQLEFVELALQGRDPIAGLELAALAPKGVGATRR